MKFLTIVLVFLIVVSIAQIQESGAYKRFVHVATLFWVMSFSSSAHMSRVRDCNIVIEFVRCISVITLSHIPRRLRKFTKRDRKQEFDLFHWRVCICDNPYVLVFHKDFFDCKEFDRKQVFIFVFNVDLKGKLAAMATDWLRFSVFNFFCNHCMAYKINQKKNRF